MSILDPNEVLFHLNQMGYTDITAEQLKKFMTGTFLNHFCGCCCYSVFPFVYCFDESDVLKSLTIENFSHELFLFKPHRSGQLKIK